MLKQGVKVLKILLHRFHCDPVFERHLFKVDITGLLHMDSLQVGVCDMKAEGTKLVQPCAFDKLTRSNKVPCCERVDLPCTSRERLAAGHIRSPRV